MGIATFRRLREREAAKQKAASVTPVKKTKPKAKKNGNLNSSDSR
tara:strand:+ start:327 stop:461 length:135 start_codon:yes stop_codon:yes gene_type:complete